MKHLSSLLIKPTSFLLPLFLLTTTPPSSHGFTTNNRRLSTPSLFLSPLSKQSTHLHSTPPSSSYITYTALSPGDDPCLSIKIGSASLSRKAWKKRRRSDSPILTPCTILSAGDETSVIRRNVVYLLHKYGERGEDGGVVLKVKRLVGLYEREMGGDLASHATSLQHENIGSLLLHIFSTPSSSNNNSNNNPNVKIIKTPQNLLLYSPLSRHRARDAASRASLIQLSSSSSQLLHTGLLKSKNDEGEWTLQPLSAALRTSPSATSIEEGRIIETARMFSFDQMGDGGSPLLTLTLNNNVGESSSRLEKRRRREEDVVSLMSEEDVVLPFEDLSVGMGPLEGKVVRLSERAGAAFVDLGVGRKRSGKSGGGVKRVLGMLRFEELLEQVMREGEACVEEEEEEEEELEIVEDITDLFDFDEDGNLMGVDDGDEGEDEIDDELITSQGDDDEDDDDDDDLFEGMSPEERLHAIGEMLAEKEVEIDDHETTSASSSPTATSNDESTISSQNDKNKQKYDPTQPSYLSKGDTIPVYISRIFPQSSRFMLSLTPPPTASQSPQDIKQSKLSSKRLSKLASDGILPLILKNEGVECRGVVKAKSRSGGWYYVQPEVEGLPVGVAMTGQVTEAEEEESIEVGDGVMVILDGIDEGRGQLKMNLMGKLRP